MKCVDLMSEISIIRLRMTIDLDKRSKNGRNTYELNIKLNTLLEIDFDSTSSNESGRLTF